MAIRQTLTASHRALVVALAATITATLWSVAMPCSAMAEDAAMLEGEELEEYPRLKALRAWGREAAKSLANATPEMREVRREEMLERLEGASEEERRKILRREYRIMQLVPGETRELIERENQAFRKARGIEPWRDRPGAKMMRELDVSPDERRALRSRFKELPRRERRKLWRKIKNMRNLPEAEKAELRAKLAEMKALSKNEKRELLDKAERWSQMPDEKREKLREQMKRLRAMPADERSELLERALGEKALGDKALGKKTPRDDE